MLKRFSIGNIIIAFFAFLTIVSLYTDAQPMVPLTPLRVEQLAQRTNQDMQRLVPQGRKNIFTRTPSAGAQLKKAKKLGFLSSRIVKG